MCYDGASVICTNYVWLAIDNGSLLVEKGLYGCESSQNFHLVWTCEGLVDALSVFRLPLGLLHLPLDNFLLKHVYFVFRETSPLTLRLLRVWLLANCLDACFWSGPHNFALENSLACRVFESQSSVPA